jgi:Protein of unknown function (DUF2958)
VKLMTKAIERKLEKNPLYSGEDKSLEERAILVKFFTPDSNWTWYVLEGEKQEDGDWLFFGYVQGFENEYGNFLLSELQRARGPLGLAVERDLYFEGKTMMDVTHAEGIAA